MSAPAVSIVIPTRNEREDIRRTLDACVALRPPAAEIIVVDDSDDGTGRIVEEYRDAGVTLVERERNEHGRCGARNLGIERSRGDVVVVLNADVLPPPDFVARILAHYERGADYVLVESEVANPEDLFARFVQVLHQEGFDAERLDWTEGFSCRRSAALAAGGFPTPPVTLLAGEDNHFGRRLREAGYRRAMDPTIVVRHLAPARLRDYWQARKVRSFPPTAHFLEGRSLGYLTLKAPAKTLLALLKTGLVVPALARAWRLARRSPRGAADWLPFAWAQLVQDAALVAGEWSGLAKLWRHRLRAGRG